MLTSRRSSANARYCTGRVSSDAAGTIPAHPRHRAGPFREFRTRVGPGSRSADRMPCRPRPGTASMRPMRAARHEPSRQLSGFPEPAGECALPRRTTGTTHTPTRSPSPGTGAPPSGVGLPPAARSPSAARGNDTRHRYGQEMSQFLLRHSSEGRSAVCPTVCPTVCHRNSSRYEMKFAPKTYRVADQPPRLPQIPRKSPHKPDTVSSRMPRQEPLTSPITHSKQTIIHGERTTLAHRPFDHVLAHRMVTPPIRPRPRP